MSGWPLTITVSGHPPGPNDRLHWQARRRLQQPFKESVGWQAKAFGLPQPLERAHVQVTFIYHSRRHAQDTDNLYARCKCRLRRRHERPGRTGSDAYATRREGASPPGRHYDRRGRPVLTS
jgi:hypothetical protein